MKKNVVILYGPSQLLQKPFKDTTYQYTYEIMYDHFHSHEIGLFRASCDWFDFKRNVFTHAWAFLDGQWKICLNVHPDVIFDKTSSKARKLPQTQSLAEMIPFVNPINFSTLIDNKEYIPILFPKFTKKQINIVDKNSIDHITDLSSEQVVVKPSSLSRGRDIHIMTKTAAQEFLASNTNTFQWIVQEFIDASQGIPHIMTGTHDLRLVVINRDIVLSYYRKPPAGSLIANIALGGTKEIIETKDIPSSAKEIVSEVSARFSPYHNLVYSVDLMFDELGDPWIVELNSVPGLYTTPADKDRMNTLYEKMLQLFDRI